MPNNPTFTPQVYAPLYASINGEAQSFVTQIDLDFDANSPKVSTIMRQFSGVSQGASEINFTAHAVVPYAPTDAQGTGMNVKGSTSAGVQLIQTMITTINANGSTPIQLVVGIGGLGGNGLPDTQCLINGFITKASMSYSTSGIPMIVYSGTGQMVPFV